MSASRVDVASADTWLSAKVSLSHKHKREAASVTLVVVDRKVSRVFLLLLLLSTHSLTR